MILPTPHSTAPAWPRRLAAHAAVLTAYAAVTVVFTWPLAAQLDSVLTGTVTGDTGLYVWNLWVFGHELLDNGQSPFYTTAIFSLGPSVDLALHNYTPITGLLGVPLIPAFGLVGAFNLIYMSLIVATAYTMYLLARDVAGDGVEAWLAGLVLAFSPALVARGTAHFSLVAAAPLPLFVLLLRVTQHSGRQIHMVALGGVFAWATYSDPYYGVYCVVLALWHLGASTMSVGLVEPDAPVPAWLRRTVRTVIAGSVLLTCTIAITGGSTVVVGPLTIGLQTLYTPMLVLTAAALVEFMLWYRPRAVLHVSAPVRTLVRLAPWGVLAGGLLLLPMLWPMAHRIVEGRFVSPGVLWRTSTPGVDVLSFFLPNPNHPLVYPWLSGWLAAREGGFVENVASIPFVAMGVIVAAGLAWRHRAHAYWIGLAVLAGSFALGPFVSFGGANLHVPTPWAIVRYLPLIGQARAPARFTVLVMLAVATLFAIGLRSLGRQHPARRRALVAVVAAVLAFELLPAPRPVYPASIPSVYDVIAADPRDIRVLELPFGVRDGLSSFGDFNASAQFHQTYHGKRLIGGYLSRVSLGRVESIRRFPVLNALMLLSQNAPVPPDLSAAAEQRADRFIEDARVGWVVIAHRRCPPALADFAIRTLDLEFVVQSDTRTLYRPRQGTSRASLAATGVSQDH